MASPTTITAPRLSHRATTGLALSTLLLGGAVAAAVVVGGGASDAEPRPTPEPVTRTIHQSADAAERWSTSVSSPVAPTAAAAALDRFFADQRSQDDTSCRGGSVDAMERCVGG